MANRWVGQYLGLRHFGHGRVPDPSAVSARKLQQRNGNDFVYSEHPRRVQNQCLAGNCDCGFFNQHVSEPDAILDGCRKHRPYQTSSSDFGHEYHGSRDGYERGHIHEWKHGGSSHERQLCFVGHLPHGLRPFDLCGTPLVRKTDYDPKMA